ncbi:MAG: DNA internalization-related competence protein ComEC/Rec2 [Lachnospiraceae bacterium]|nr:DNA internalization-related competence protein ComEC/Rec2 [Lachnospiraceae bacterium]
MAKRRLAKWRKTIKRPVMWVVLLLTAIVLVALDTAEKHLNIPRHSTVEGEVCGVVADIEYKNDKAYLYLKNVEFLSEELRDFKEIKSSLFLCRKMGMVCALDSEAAEVFIGSRVCVRGKINVYDRATNPGEFDSRRYYISKGYLFKAYSCELVSSDHKRKIVSDISYRISERVGELLDHSLNKKDAGMMKAVLLADKTDLDKDIKDLYKDAGAGHLLAISGLHITMFAALLLFILKKTPINLKADYIITILFLYGYGFVIGFSASALRAIVMFTIMCIGSIFNKSYDSLTAMAVALLITILFRPLYVLQTGFLMSYLAIVAIAVVLPIFAIIGKKSGLIVSSFTMSTSVYLTTLPMIVNSYYKIPLYAPFLNIILVPGMSVLLMLGILCVCARAFIESAVFINACKLLFAGSLISKNVYVFLLSGKFNIFAIGIHLFLEVYEWLMSTELSWPRAIVTTGARGLFRCLLYELILLASAVIIRKIKLALWRKDKLINNRIRLYPSYNPTKEIRDIRRKRVVFTIVSALVLLLNIAGFLIYWRKDKIEFLDVGQGLCACIQYKGKVYCYDGGSTDKKNIDEYILSPYFAYYGIESVDAWFISHEDADHTSGIKGLLENDGRGSIEIKEIIIPGALEERFSSIISSTEDVGTEVIYSKAGDVFTSNDGISFTVLSPEEDFVSDDSNACSLVVLMKAAETDVLFMGDADVMAEEKVLSFMSEPIDILQVAHHGSANNTNSEYFIRTLNPRISVISCGFDNIYGHPHKETLEILNKVNTKIIRTDQSGTVLFWLF